ncbi:multidrug effflux MFS transporter [Martelella alba]|uniref:Bcr/CflA family efflux transporter n=1 Tax=Martelella alba TaxID=2590451 RepID=A0ABY2SJ78_9HYPH|nr:multidrug effflux MFS transporter [Martelella alba]TKI04586.1 multidrug effflux MFS transporter [Martelella alba]
MQRISLRTAVILGALTALGPVCTDLYLPALPAIQQELGSGTALVQMTLTASLIGLGVGQLIFGPLSDRLGRKGPLMLSLAIFILSSIACARIDNVPLLIIMRFVQGLAGAGGSVLSRAVARDKYHGNTLVAFFALLMAINGVAPVISPVIGSYIASIWGWRDIFTIMAVLGILLLASSVCWIAETLPKRAKGVSLIKQSARLLANRAFAMNCLVQSFLTAGLFAYIGASSFVLQNEYHLTLLQFSYVFGCNGVGLLLSSLFFSRLSVRFSLGRIYNIGLVADLVLAGLLLLGVMNGLPLTGVLILLFLTVSMISGIGTLAASLAMDSVRPEQSGTASAFLGFAMFLLGGIAAPATAIGGVSMLKMSVAIVLCFLIALLLRWSHLRSHAVPRP